MKSFLLIILLLVAGRSVAQNAGASERLQRWRELNLSVQQKERIRALVLRQRMQQYLDWAELNRILTHDQKKKLRAWRDQKRQQQKSAKPRKK